MSSFSLLSFSHPVLFSPPVQQSQISLFHPGSSRSEVSNPGLRDPGSSRAYDPGFVNFGGDPAQRPTVSFALAGSQDIESRGVAHLTVNLSAAYYDLPITINYAATGGTAVGGGVDYILPAGKLVFNSGETTKTIDVSLVNHPLTGPNKTIQVTLSNPVNATLGNLTVHTFTIQDDKVVPTLVPFQNAGSVRLSPDGTGVAYLSVSLTRPYYKDVTFSFSGTGTGNVWYISQGTVTIRAGATSAQFNVGFHVYAGHNATAVITLGNVTNAKLGFPHSYTLALNSN
jgi:hypothetical protein